MYSSIVRKPPPARLAQTLTSRSYAWDQSIPGGSCQPNDVLAYVYYVTTAINIAMDWYCALLPVVILWNAPLPRREKLSISLLLGMGVLASISACVRQVYTSALTQGTHDSIDTFADLVIWGCECQRVESCQLDITDVGNRRRASNRFPRSLVEYAASLVLAPSQRRLYRLPEVG